MTVVIKILVLLIFFVIVASLASGAYYLVRDGSDRKRVVRALTVRITLSVALFSVLIALFLFGVIEPNDPFRP
ncbi:twin transmembrane helix small protein [Methylonatrum kenyense]|uniref:twin transmembrane helix small protein n=1 Tax=Methylonatrum kenyense TaxID=455253 RepID=UPI0020BD8907|nr:twin transmembrane helix small protein [Methylonatrum kenyense]MCK8516918.1 twin transmembrane helix small protein [Methylonatrum kenyense]